MTTAVDSASAADVASADRHRPHYHVVSPANWLNDPNGLVQHRGTYHLFYQYNPNNPRSETKHWGHVSSADLVHWRHRPIALAPTPGGPDADGCYSGCAVDLGDEVLFMYTGVRGDRQLPCVATSTDDELVTWTKRDDNPVIAETPPELDLVYYRDHTVWREGDTWYQGIATRIREVGGAVLVYRSPDLLTWEYLHPLATGNLDRADPLWGGTGWECPDFFAAPAGDQHVLIVSGHDDRPKNVLWFTGAYQDQQLETRARGLVDGGPSFYAPQSFTDEQGRRVMFGWFRERRPVAAQVAAGWSGAMTLPRVLSVAADGALVSAPAPENDLLREQALDARVDADGGTTLAGDTLELRGTFRVGTEPVGIRVRANGDGSEFTEIVYSPRERTLAVDTRQASTAPDNQGMLSVLPVAGEMGSEMSLRVYLDRSVLEVFLDDRVCISERMYPADVESTGIRVIGADYLVSLEAWAMGNAFEQG